MNIRQKGARGQALDVKFNLKAHYTRQDETLTKIADSLSSKFEV